MGLGRFQTAVFQQRHRHHAAPGAEQPVEQAGDAAAQPPQCLRREFHRGSPPFCAEIFPTAVVSPAELILYNTFVGGRNSRNFIV